MFRRTKKNEPHGQLSEIELSVPGMMCDGCAEKVRTALAALDGVREVKPSAWRKRVRVRFEGGQVETSHLRAALAEAGFDTTVTP